MKNKALMETLKDFGRTMLVCLGLLIFFGIIFVPLLIWGSNSIFSFSGFVIIFILIFILIYYSHKASDKKGSGKVK